MTFTTDAFIESYHEMSKIESNIAHFDVILITDEQYVSILKHMHSTGRVNPRVSSQSYRYINGTPLETTPALWFEVALTGLALKGKRVGWWDNKTQQLEVQEPINPSTFTNHHGPILRDVTGDHLNPFDFLYDHAAWFAYSKAKHYLCCVHTACLKHGMLETNQDVVYVGDDSYMSSDRYREHQR